MSTHARKNSREVSLREVDPRDEWARIEAEILKKQTASLERQREMTRESLKILEETKASGIQTAYQLHSQGNQLKGLQNKMDHIEDNMNASKRLLRGISSMGRTVYNYFSSP